MYIGEVGFDLTAIKGNQKYSMREEFFQDVDVIVDRKQISGAVIWNVAQETDEYFSLSFDDVRDSEILSEWGNIAGNSAALSRQ